jgi:hypothetical protein
LELEPYPDFMVCMRTLHRECGRRFALAGEWVAEVPAGRPEENAGIGGTR